MTNEKTQKTIAKVIKQTKDGKLNWKRLSPNDFNIFLDDVVDCEYVNYIESFKCTYGDGFIYLIYELTYILFIQPGVDKTLTPLDVPQSKLAQLRNIIRDNIDNIDSFVDSLLKE